MPRMTRWVGTVRCWSVGRVAAEQGEGHPRRAHALQLDGLAHGREVPEVGDRVVVDPDDRHRAGHRDPGAPQAAQCAHRHLVAEGEDSRGRTLRLSSRSIPCAPIVVLHGRSTTSSGSTVEAGVLECGPVAVQPIHRRRVRPLGEHRRIDHRDPLVPGPDQVGDRLPRRRDVVDAHVRVVEQCAAGDDHRHAEQVQLPALEVADREGDHDDRVDLALHRQVGEEPSTLTVVGDLVDERVEPLGAQHRQHAGQHRAVEPASSSAA